MEDDELHEDELGLVSSSPQSSRRRTRQLYDLPLASQSFISNGPPLSFMHVEIPDSQNLPAHRKKVRSHVMREYHRNKRLAAVIEHRASQESQAGSSNWAKSKSRDLFQEAANDGGDRSLTPVRLSPPPAYLDNLIPYSYAIPSGPVLYLKPANWPFPRPFAMTGANRAERFGSSIFPRQSIWMPNAFIADGVVNKGPLLGGDVLSWISHSPECFKYRVGLIKWIQDRLNVPETATNDGVIGAIMTLTMWENGDSSSLDLKNHMNGLHTIVSLRGGLSNLHLAIGMNAKIILFDYILAVSCAENPRFEPSLSPQPQIAPNNVSRDGTIAVSPLYGNGDFSTVACNSHQNQIKYLLEVMWGLTSRALGLDLSEPGVRQKQDASQSFAILDTSSDSGLSLQVSADCNNDNKSHIFNVLHYTALIYQRAVSYPHISFNSTINHADLVALYETLNDTASDAFWLYHPGILLWVLLVACAVAATRKERSYFMMFLAKVGIFTEPRCWYETQTAVLRFLEVQKLSRL